MPCRGKIYLFFWPMLYVDIGPFVLISGGQTKADCQCPVNLIHMRFIQCSHFLTQPAFIQGTNLFRENHRIPCQAKASGTKGNMCRHFRFIDLRCNRGCNHSRTVPVSNIILHNEYRAHAALLAAYHRRQICIIDISTLDMMLQCNHTPKERYFRMEADVLLILLLSPAIRWFSHASNKYFSLFLILCRSPARIE